MGSNKYIITKIKCGPAFKQDPRLAHSCFFLGYLYFFRKIYSCVSGTDRHTHLDDIENFGELFLGRLAIIENLE